MAQLTIIYWRDIPAQIIAKTGRNSAKRELAPRFQEAIDRAAMASGARDDDAYLAAWRRSTPTECGADLDAVVEETALRLEAEYDASRLTALVAAGGRAS